jgi:hypothetical protein
MPEAHCGVRLRGDERAVDHGEREADEVVGGVTAGVVAECDRGLLSQELQGAPTYAFDHGVDSAVAGGPWLRSQHD